jgi:hypothetical protein
MDEGRRRSARIALGCGFALACASMPIACGMSGEDAGFTAGGEDGAGVGGAFGGGASGPSTGTGGPPPEQELESSFGAPVATGRFVWIANPSSGRVAYIDAKTLSIRIVEAGHAPTYLAALPDPDVDAAVVLNALSLDATVFHAKKDGELTSLSLPVPTGGNAWAVSKSGRWATAWTDARGVSSPDPIDGYQDVTVLDLAAGAEKSFQLAVGYRPVALGYDAAETHAFAVTEDGVSVIALGQGGPALEKNVPLSDDPLEDATTRDVSITPDGAFALVRRDGDATVRVVSLEDGARTDVVLGGPVTDLDLSADGSVAVAVVRDTGEVALLPIPAIASEPSVFSSVSVTDVPVGSVALAKESSTAILYTNATPSSALLALDTAAPESPPRPIKLHAPALAVFPTPDASHAVVFHGALGQPGGGGPSKYAAAFSVVPIEKALPSKIVGLDAPPVSIAVAPTGDRALIATGNAQSTSFHMYVARMPSLEVQSFPLASQPIAAGIVAGANRGFVAQKHPDGRITFVDFTTGEIRTLTGFELATQVVDGSEP